MPDPIFNTITSDDWKRSLAAARTTPNQVARQIRESLTSEKYTTMVLPNDDECRRIVSELEDDPGLTQWESDFIDGNRGRVTFTDKQKEVFARLKEKFEV